MSKEFTEDWLEAHNRKLRKPTQFTITSEGRETPEGLVYDIAPTPPRSKYRNRKTLVVFRPEGEIVAGHLRLSHEFDSKKEADHFAELALRRQSGQITNLVLQKAHDLTVKGVTIGRYVADFEYESGGKTTVEDVKGMSDLPLYKWKIAHLRAEYGIIVSEVR